MYKHTEVVAFHTTGAEMALKTAGGKRPAANFKEVTRLAARQAERAAKVTIDSFARKYVYDEDDITGSFVGSLNTLFHGTRIGGMTLATTVVRHRRGKAGEESRSGADMLIHASMDTPTQKYSKGVLVQAKKADLEYDWSMAKRQGLVDQCNKMLNITPAAFVMNYNLGGMRCGAATRVAGATTVFSVSYLCNWTIYRFFLELFRCPIGDPRITSAEVANLPTPAGIHEILSDIPYVVKLSLEGELDVDTGSSEP
jgi:hypothetical protein